MIDERPELRWIKLTQLFIPSEYQRSVKSRASETNIAYIKGNFNWADCGALIVCQQAGSKPPGYAVIDGQHRFRAAEARDDIPELPCVVISECAAQRQAANFITINERRVKLHPLAKHHAALVAGDADAVAVNAILKKAKITLATHTFSKNALPPHVTMAIGTLLKMIGEYSEKQMVWALSIIPEAYGDQGGMLRANLIRALAEYIKLYPDTDREFMVAALQEIDIEQLESDARAFRAVQGGSLRSAILKVIERKYNQCKRGGVARSA